jgi:hypothetical protein
VYTRTRIDFSGAGDVTLRFGLPQLELGAFATSVVQTSTAAVLRNADYVTMTGTNFSDWYNQSEGAFSIEASVVIPTTGSQIPMAINDGTSNNYLAPYILNSIGRAYYKVVQGGATQAEFSPVVTLVSNTVFKYCFGYKINNFQIAANAIAGTPDTAGNVPTVTTMEIGNQFLSSQINGHVRKINYWPQRLTNNEIQAFSK